MQYVNDDMDELFRKAAENYPLDTKGANWNKVLSALQDQNTTTAIPEKKKNNGRFLWLLLLLPLGLICNRLYSPGNLAGDSIAKSNPSNDNTLPEKQSTSQMNKDRKLNSSLEITENSNTRTSTYPNDPNIVFKSTDISNTHLIKKSSSVSKYVNSGTTNSFGPLGAGTAVGYVADPSNDELLFSRNFVHSISYRTFQQPSSVVPGRSLTPTINSPTVATTSKIQVAKRKKFYAGLMGGPDATTIKFQKIEDVGFNFGLLLGYQFNKKWSIESGAYLERKYYYSEGKYFNTSKIYMPPNAWIDDLTGNCKMIEVPVAAKYNFATGKQSGWFGVVGLTSYFLLQENYTYNYYYGTTGPVPHTKNYKNASTHIFSHISVSGGYTHRLGNFADLRVEPYVKLPISGMGVGSMPLSSAGLQVGITKKF